MLTTAGTAPGGCSPVLPIGFPVIPWELEWGAAQAAHDRAVFDLLGCELDAPGLGLAGTLGGRPPSAALLRRAGLVVALVPAASTAAGTARAGQVRQEREPGAVDPGRNVGVGL